MDPTSVIWGWGVADHTKKGGRKLAHGKLHKVMCLWRKNSPSTVCGGDGMGCGGVGWDGVGWGMYVGREGATREPTVRLAVASKGPITSTKA